MTHEIQHKPQDRLLVPIAAISNNCDFLLGLNRPVKVEFSDDTLGKVKFSRTIHILSEEATELMRDIYGQISLEQFLRVWWKKVPEMASLEFIYLEIEKSDEK
jgi:hypothetical protein